MNLFPFVRSGCVVLQALGLFTVLAVSGGCATPPVEEQAVQVEVLDSWFVRVKEERLARDEFIYRIRGQCREAKADGRPPPPVVLRWEALDDPRVGRDLMNQLLLAGVKNVTLGS